MQFQLAWIRFPKPSSARILPQPAAPHHQTRSNVSISLWCDMVASNCQGLEPNCPAFRTEYSAFDRQLESGEPWLARRQSEPAGTAQPLVASDPLLGRTSRLGSRPVPRGASPAWYEAGCTRFEPQQPDPRGGH